MSPNLKFERQRVILTAKIDGGAYRWIELPDGSSMVEAWDAISRCWTPGGASIGEVTAETPPVLPEFAARLGIPIEDLLSGTGTPQFSGHSDTKAVGLKPDYGLRLLIEGCSPEMDLYFYDFRLCSVSVLGNGNYSSMVELRHDGEVHALSLDFDQAQLEEILTGADRKVAAVVQNELSRDPTSPREMELDGYVPFAVRARLGTLQTGAHEQFVPLVAQEILSTASSNPPEEG